MPEGPEVWILAQVCDLPCFGKHLFVGEEDWSFGLNGKVLCDNAGILHKVNTGYLPGDVKVLDRTEYTGVDWLTGNRDQLQKVINNTWKSSRKMLAALLLDQKQIAGIGVAWGSEICAKSGLNPSKKACEQDLSKLVDVMCEIRDDIMQVYTNYATSVDKQEFINGWYRCLYNVRQMTVYKKTNAIEQRIGGRTWWV